MKFIKKSVMVMAHKIRREGFSLSSALKIAWRELRAGVSLTPTEIRELSLGSALRKPNEVWSGQLIQMSVTRTAYTDVVYQHAATTRVTKTIAATTYIGDGECYDDPTNYTGGGVIDLGEQQNPVFTRPACAMLYDMAKASFSGIGAEYAAVVRGVRGYITSNKKFRAGFIYTSDFQRLGVVAILPCVEIRESKPVNIEPKLVVSTPATPATATVTTTTTVTEPTPTPISKATTASLRGLAKDMEFYFNGANLRRFKAQNIDKRQATIVAVVEKIKDGSDSFAAAVANTILSKGFANGISEKQAWVLCKYAHANNLAWI